MAVLEYLQMKPDGKFEGWLEPGCYNVQNKSAENIIKEMVTARVNKLDSLGVPDGSERERIMNIASIADAEVVQS